jgi:hypothetical protein
MHFLREEILGRVFLHLLSFACAKESTKEKHTGNDPDSYRDGHCRTP